MGERHAAEPRTRVRPWSAFFLRFGREQQKKKVCVCVCGLIFVGACFLPPPPGWNAAPGPTLRRRGVSYRCACSPRSAYAWLCLNVWSLPVIVESYSPCFETWLCPRCLPTLLYLADGNCESPSHMRGAGFFLVWPLKRKERPPSSALWDVMHPRVTPTLPVPAERRTHAYENVLMCVRRPHHTPESRRLHLQNNTRLASAWHTRPHKRFKTRDRSCI